MGWHAEEPVANLLSSTVFSIFSCCQILGPYPAESKMKIPFGNQRDNESIAVEFEAQLEDGRRTTFRSVTTRTEGQYPSRSAADHSAYNTFHSGAAWPYLRCADFGTICFKADGSTRMGHRFQLVAIVQSPGKEGTHALIFWRPDRMDHTQDMVVEVSYWLLGVLLKLPPFKGWKDEVQRFRPKGPILPGDVGDHDDPRYVIHSQWRAVMSAKQACIQSQRRPGSGVRSQSDLLLLCQREISSIRNKQAQREDNHRRLRPTTPPYTIPIIRFPDVNEPNFETSLGGLLNDDEMAWMEDLNTPGWSPLDQNFM